MVDDALTAEEIRAALERIVVSSSFRRSPQLVAFLRFVVELTLGGNAKYIKSYTIAVEALGRGERFDPQVDPIVRVEAARIRRALASYFAGEGAGLPGHYRNTPWGLRSGISPPHVRSFDRKYDCCSDANSFLHASSITNETRPFCFLSRAPAVANARVQVRAWQSIDTLIRILPHAPLQTLHPIRRTANVDRLARDRAAGC